MPTSLVLGTTTGFVAVLFTNQPLSCQRSVSIGSKPMNTLSIVVEFIGCNGRPWGLLHYAKMSKAKAEAKAITG